MKAVDGKYQFQHESGAREWGTRVGHESVAREWGTRVGHESGERGCTEVACVETLNASPTGYVGFSEVIRASKTCSTPSTKSAEICK